MLAKDHFQAGRLADAVAAATEEVRANPADVAKRGFLCELLCFAGDLERADRQLDAAARIEAKQAIGITLLRQLIRAEQARYQFYREGRVPEMLEQPGPDFRRRLEASILVREGKPAEAAKILEQAEAERVPVSGKADGAGFEDFRDLDDFTATFLEVLTTNGKYYWASLNRIDVLEFHPPQHPHELLWRRAHLVMRGGPDGEVYCPALYHGSHEDQDERIRLGRATEWRGGGDAPVRGAGQRTFLVGDRDVPILQLTKVEIQGAAQ
jgi:type VI secretion system protein ImpE